MPAKTPQLDNNAAAQLTQLAQQLRAHRKALGVNATIAGEAANMSRFTVRRIEKGEPTVTLGAYLNLAAALGLELTLLNPKQEEAELGNEIDLTPYPHIQQLAWHVKAGETLTALELWQIIQRNQKHLDMTQLNINEQAFLQKLEQQFKNHV